MDKIQSFVTKLCEHTRAGTIQWSRTPDSQVFQAPLAGFVVRFRRKQSTVHPVDDLYLLDIYNSDEELIDSFDDESLNRMYPTERNTWFKMMREAYESARRTAVGIDAALDQLLGELDKPPF